MAKKIPKDILEILQGVTGKRAKIVIDHIIKHGHITTVELKEQYGYNHPPRAARDVREQGIPLETFYLKDRSGLVIGAYCFGKWEDLRTSTLKGRRAFSKQFKKELAIKYGEKCLVCSAELEERYLQIDHRIPYQVVGDDRLSDRKLDQYMLICSSCNRAKSWSCEHCTNWQTKHDPTVCAKCYWASPIEYKHIAMHDFRRLAIAWQDDEVYQYDCAKKMAAEEDEDMPTFVKILIRNRIKQ